MIGKTIQNIKITDLLGKGGMGTVYKGQDVMLKRDVAVKVLHPELLYDDQVTRRFQTEAIMLASLNHPNITSLFNLIKDKENYMMIMEFVKGESLEDILNRKKKIPEQEAIEFTIQALEGLKHAHRKKIVHRDLKLANIMVSDEGVVKIMDFGIARVLGSSRMTSAGRVIGTLEYMSPEQVKGEEGDERSDIYALGTVLYEMVAGQVPFKSTSDYDLMTSKINQRPPSIRSFVETNPALDAILGKSMEIKPGQRYQTAIQFQEALDDYKKKQIAKSAQAGQKSYTKAALLKNIGRRKETESGKKEFSMVGKQERSAGKPGEISEFFHPLIRIFNNNKRIITISAAAVLSFALLIGVAHKIRKTRISGKHTAGKEIVVDQDKFENQGSDNTDQAGILFPEKPKLDPSSLPGSPGAADQKKPEGQVDHTAEIRSSRKASTDSKKHTEADPEKAGMISKTEDKTSDNRAADRSKDAKPENTGETGVREAIEEDPVENGPEAIIRADTSKADQKDSKESIGDKINETGAKIIKDFKEILFDKSEDKPKPKIIYIQSYTPIYVKLSEAVSSENAYPGQVVTLIVEKDVMADGQVAVHSGQALKGNITYVKSSGGSRKGVLELQIHSIIISGSQSIPLRASTFRIIGESGQDARFPEGQIFEVQAAQRTKLTIEG